LGIDVATVDERRKMPLRLGTAFLILGAFMFIGSFVVAANTPMGIDTRGCTPHRPCDVGADPSHRQSVFFVWMGATLIVFAGGVVLRSIGNRDAE
jgi:hypothetical protein